MGTSPATQVPKPAYMRRLAPGGAVLPGDAPEFQRFVATSRPIELDGIEWSAIPDHPLSEDTLRVLAYMQDVESHTVVFPRTLFSRNAVDDEEVGTFLICWLYEEGMHGRVLAKFLDCAGHPVKRRTKGRTTRMDHVNRAAVSLLSSFWKDFLAMHMAWGAVHECTTIHAYRRMIQQNDHPVLNELLERVVRDESRHFAFYMWQAKRRLARPGVARKVRAIMNRLYVPVGVSHQPDELARWVSGFLFGGDKGRAAAERVDRTIAGLPGFADARLLTTWIERNVHT